MSQDISNFNVPPGGSISQTETVDSGQIVTERRADGTQLRYKINVPAEDIPVVDSKNAVEENNQNANSNPNNIVNRDPPKLRGRFNSKVDPSLRSVPFPPTPTPAVVNFNKQDKRVRIKVPSFYLNGICAGPIKNNTTELGILAQNQGIVFPYTPSITVSHSASYDSKNVLHSNYAQYFYKSSSVSEINITGRFTAQNEYEAQIILAVQHLGRALTKMQYGNDEYAGAPPPVCELYGYGDYMFNSLPIGISEFSLTYPADVDYITLSTPNVFGNTSVPVSTEVTLKCVILYSKQEILGSSVNGYINNGDRLRGYL